MSIDLRGGKLRVEEDLALEPRPVDEGLVYAKFTAPSEKKRRQMSFVGIRLLTGTGTSKELIRVSADEAEWGFNELSGAGGWFAYGQNDGDLMVRRVSDPDKGFVVTVPKRAEDHIGGICLTPNHAAWVYNDYSSETRRIFTLDLRTGAINVLSARNNSSLWCDDKRLLWYSITQKKPGPIGPGGNSYSMIRWPESTEG